MSMCPRRPAALWPPLSRGQDSRPSPWSPCMGPGASQGSSLNGPAPSPAFLPGSEMLPAPSPLPSSQHRGAGSSQEGVLSSRSPSGPSMSLNV